MKKLVILTILSFFITNYTYPNNNILLKLSKPKARISVKILNDKELKLDNFNIELYLLKDKDKIKIDQKEYRKGVSDIFFLVSKGEYEVVVVYGDKVFSRKVDIKQDKEYKISFNGYSMEKGGLVLYCGFESEEEIKSLGGVINRLGKNRDEKIEIVGGKVGNGLYVGGPHEESSTYDQVFIPLQGELTSESGTIEFWFKPVGWDSSDECPAHLLLSFVNDTNYLNRFLNYKENTIDLHFWYAGNGNNFIFSFAKIIKENAQWNHSMNWRNFTWFSTPSKDNTNWFSFKNGDWIHFKMIWDKSKSLLDGVSQMIIINSKIYAKNYSDIPEVILFPRFIAIGNSGGWWYERGPDANMYMLANGIFDELYIWNYPKLDQ